MGTHFGAYVGALLDTVLPLMLLVGLSNSHLVLLRHSEVPLDILGLLLSEHHLGVHVNPSTRLIPFFNTT